jgi:hypothetical protein
MLKASIRDSSYETHCHELITTGTMTTMDTMPFDLLVS